MSNIHSELVDSQLHNPKGFATAGASTVLTKDATNNLVWDNITDGFTCGIYKAYDYARWSHVSRVFNNAVPLSGQVTLTNCSGVVGRRLQVEVVVSTPSLPGGTDPGVWIGLQGDNSQDILTNAMGQETKITPTSPPFTSINNPGIGRVYYKWSITFDVIGSLMSSVGFKIGAVTSKVCDEGESYIMVKELCKVFTPEDLG